MKFHHSSLKLLIYRFCNEWGQGSDAARNDAEEASLDAQAEMDDTAAALNGASESS